MIARTSGLITTTALGCDRFDDVEDLGASRAESARFWFKECGLDICRVALGNDGVLRRGDGRGEKVDLS